MLVWTPSRTAETFFLCGHHQRERFSERRAPTSIVLPLPDEIGQALQLRIALIRDLCRKTLLPLSEEERDSPRRLRRGFELGGSQVVGCGMEGLHHPLSHLLPMLYRLLCSNELSQLRQRDTT
jgi:hypothetical protein